MRRSEAICVLLAVCLLPALVYSNTVAQVWAESDADIGQPTAMVVDNMGDVYVTGQTWNGHDYDFATMKYRGSNGFPVWPAPAVFAGAAGGNDCATALALGSSGDVFVTGYTWNGADYDYATVRYNVAGGEAWPQPAVYNGGGEDRPVALVVDITGNPIVAGCSWNGVDFDYLTIKYNAPGGEAWPQPAAYNGGGEDRPVAVAIGLDGNPIVTGYSWLGSGFDYLTIKYEGGSGFPLWPEPARYDRGGEDRAAALALDPGGNAYVTGYSWNGADFDYVTLKYDAGVGMPCWFLPGAAVFNSGGDDRATAIAVDPTGCACVTGYSGAASLEDFATVKYDPEGMQQWSAVYDGAPAGADRARAIALDNLGCAYVTGVSEDAGGLYDYVTVKYSEVGIERWVARYGTPVALDEPQAVLLHDNGYMLADVFVTGSAGPVSATIKYQQPNPGWTRQSDLPGTLKVKTGGCLAWTEENGRGYVYALKGNKSYDFLKYRICDRWWQSAPAIPSGSPGKKVDDGATLARLGNSLFATKGGGSNQFWEYNPSADWTARTPVPGSNVQYGAGAVGGLAADGSGCVYLLKGSGGKEFYRYSPSSGWTNLAQIPGSGGCGRGSCVTYAPTIGTRGTVFALKGSSGTNQFYAYDVASGAWSAKASLPLVGSSGSHEAKDGTGLAWLNGFVYALKGNSTREFWGYAPGTPGQWTELTSIGGTITVGEGGALGASDDLLYALKGNSTVECWMHSPGGWDLMGASEELTLDAGPQPGYALAVTPNPLRERTVVSYSLPGAASVLVCLYDVTGARVVTLVSGRASAGSHYVAFRANGLAHGVYLLKLESGGAGVTRKLIVE